VTAAALLITMGVPSLTVAQPPSVLKRLSPFPVFNNTRVDVETVGEIVAANGTVLNQIPLPAGVNALQRRFGFEGVASVGSGAAEQVYLAIQREWVDEPAGQVRISRCVPATGE
jgi:hypothetical protein